MERAAPTRSINEETALAGGPRKTTKRLVRKYRKRTSSARLEYIALLIQRYAAGLLAPFKCSSCNAWSLDPIGWNGPGKPVCQPCSEARQSVPFVAADAPHKDTWRFQAQPKRGPR
jgi:hypothetical protein